MTWEKKCLFNRTTILGPNGTQTLTVPIHSTGGRPVCIKDIRICYQQNWIRVHTGALLAAYNSSPFFQMFKDELFTVFAGKPEFLFDLNQELNGIIIGRLLKGKQKPDSQSNEATLTRDLRYLKDQNSIEFHLSPATPYVQVFSDRFPFTPFLSWIDWLSNTGGR